MNDKNTAELELSGASVSGSSVPGVSVFGFCVVSGDSVDSSGWALTDFCVLQPSVSQVFLQLLCSMFKIFSVTHSDERPRGKGEQPLKSSSICSDPPVRLNFGQNNHEIYIIIIHIIYNFLFLCENEEKIRQNNCLEAKDNSTIVGWFCRFTESRWVNISLATLCKGWMTRL